MTDFFLLLMIPGAGDELQGIKRGIIEMLDGMAINKADGDNKSRAHRARVEYSSALHLFPPSPDGWVPRVLTCSSLHNEGIAEIWDTICEHREHQTQHGHFTERRRRQSLQWMRELVSLGLEDLFRTHSAVRSRMRDLELAVKNGSVSSFSAAHELLSIFRKEP
jgi:LAO/AO transport system kinase